MKRYSPTQLARRKRYREHHDRMAEVEKALDLALSSSRLGICHTLNQVKAGAKQLTRNLERSLYATVQN